ncbi:MAG TPA: transglycosylase SLT domain-containing protein [Gemmatimonadaceae bacterium]|nr:transglycosylase SLT domain-containing protein [Gemmatimonadaceae bacterium]
MAKSVRPPSWLKQLALGVGALATLVFTAQHVRPVYAGRAPVVEELLGARESGDSALARAPWVHAPGDVALLSPQYEIDRRAFMDDLIRTTKVAPARADSLATFAVREAYRRRIPPALVFGVLLVENRKLKSTARSNAGAVGLMQIDPSAWLRSLGKRFGTNLRNDETNLRYGVFILSHLLYDSDKAVGPADSAAVHGSLRRGLLRYNGCVRGTNTKNCFRYPDVVRARIDTHAIAQCGVRGYERCVAEPLKYALSD